MKAKVSHTHREVLDLHRIPFHPPTFICPLLSVFTFSRVIIDPFMLMEPLDCPIYTIPWIAGVILLQIIVAHCYLPLSS